MNNVKFVGQIPQAVRDILAERLRQTSVEGYTPEHDDEHGDGSLAQAAGCYALASMGYYTNAAGEIEDPESDWPWDPECWKPGTPRRMLEKAGALILAEMERLDRTAGIAVESAPVDQVSLHVGGDQFVFGSPEATEIVQTALYQSEVSDRAPVMFVSASLLSMVDTLKHMPFRKNAEGLFQIPLYAVPPVPTPAASAQQDEREARPLNAIEREAIASFRKEMRDNVIPKAMQRIADNQRAVAEIRHIPLTSAGERQAFEAFAIAYGADIARHGSHDGSAYVDNYVDDMWDAWQARAQQVQADAGAVAAHPVCWIHPDVLAQLQQGKHHGSFGVSAKKGRHLSSPLYAHPSPAAESDKRDAERWRYCLDICHELSDERGDFLVVSLQKPEGMSWARSTEALFTAAIDAAMSREPQGGE